MTKQASLDQNHNDDTFNLLTVDQVILEEAPIPDMLVSDSAHKSHKHIYKSINMDSAKNAREGLNSVEKVKEQIGSMINRPHQSNTNFSALSMKSVE